MYCIDTSSILHAWRRDYPPDRFPSLWRELEALVAAQQLIAPDEVLSELERRDDEVCEWARQNAQMFVEPDGPVQDGVRDIVDRWDTFVPAESYDGVWADPYVIALAQTRAATVVTGEVLVPPNARRPRIPNICQALGVPWMALLGMIRAEDWTF